MSTSSDPQREHPSTYIVQDRSNETEIQRLQLQDRMINAGMGGLLPEQTDPIRFESVLDVGCGTGGWLIELAKAYPGISRLVGVDVSNKMLDFAHAQAEAQGVGERVEFQMMDALRMLEFPDASFDLVNQRFGASYLRTWDWPKLLQEYQRITRRNGVIRITETDVSARSNGEALVQMGELILQAFYQAGFSFHPTGDGVTGEIPRLLQRHDVQNIRTREYNLEFQAGTVAGEYFAGDMQRVFRTTKPFLQKWTRLPDDYEEIYQRMIAEMNQPDFVGKMRLVTVWGTKA